MSMKNVPDWLVCRAVQAYQDDAEKDFFPYDLLTYMTGECEKVCIRAMERACRHELIEYGVSLRTGWLTQKGKDLIRVD